MLPLILLVPLIAAILAIIPVRNHMRIRYIALGGTLISLALLPFVSYGLNTIPWFSIGKYAFSITTIVTPINLLLLAIVLGIGPLIFYYSSGYMDKPSEQKRYYIELLGFEAAMLTFAMAGNLIVFFIAWEFLSMTSYLLIGFWYNEKPAKAAREAITIIMLGDLALIGAIVVILTSLGTLDLTTLIVGAPAHAVVIPNLAIALLVLAIMTKSAQFPFQEWLADAMEGPTPVSAFLHSTTMVKAGVFAAIALSPIFIATGTVWVLFVVGLVTSIIAMFNATREFQIKRVMAYSTIQELSLMLVAVGGGAISAAIYFFFAQSFYKALLFFNSGTLMKATGREDIREMSGLASNKKLYFTTLFGVLALAGFIPFDGFFANASLAGGFANNLAMYAVISLLGMGTSFYIFRWTTYLSKRPTNSLTTVNLNAPPRPMLYSAMILAPFTLVASFMFLYIPTLFNNSYNLIPYVFPSRISFVDLAIETVLTALGACAGYWIYTKGKTAIKSGALNTLLYSSVIFRWLYDHVAAFAYILADGVSTFDSYLSGAFDSLGKGTVLSSSVVKKMAIGRINQYALVVAMTLVIVFVYVYAVVM